MGLHIFIDTRKINLLEVAPAVTFVNETETSRLDRSAKFVEVATYNSIQFNPIHQLAKNHDRLQATFGLCVCMVKGYSTKKGGAHMVVTPPATPAMQLCYEGEG